MARYNNDLPFNLNDRITDTDLKMGFDHVVREWRGTTSSRSVREAGRYRKFVERRFVRAEELAIWNEFAHRAAEDDAATIKLVLRDLHAEIDRVNAEGIGSVFIRKPTHHFFRKMVDRACEELA
ncbi:hypothetical protein [Sinorhizobium terangae]|uniref:hypothetical protein n=1 Tax=Sinorhizobium terangae TaxID=110322 RepID=UPI0024B1C8C6|nr:hypothetical protein [Sinorhizobium terangae]WFU49173.1 hypothetical protein QA637_07180 [Sinorhizobium terangae]